MPLILISRKRLPRPVLYLSSYFERNNDLYRDLLLQVSQRGEFMEWIHFFLKGVAESSSDTIVASKGLLSLREDYLQRFRTARSSALLQVLIDDLFQNPWTSFKRAARVLSITEAAAAANVRKLRDAGILTELGGRKRNRIFLAREILDVIEDIKRVA